MNIFRLKEEVELPTDNVLKFVRVGDQIAYARLDKANHRDIAKELGIPIIDGVATIPDGYAAMMMNEGEKIGIRGSSITCQIEGNIDDALAKTIRIIQQLTGIEVIHEEE